MAKIIIEIDIPDIIAEKLTEELRNSPNNWFPKPGYICIDEADLIRDDVDSFFLFKLLAIRS